MTDSADEPSSLRPFEPVPFHERSLIDVLRNRSRETDACAALETHLAEHGVESVNPEFAQVLLKGFGVTGDAAREMLIDVWEKALKNLLFNDGKIDAAESAYLDKLKLGFGLKDDEVEKVRSATLQREFLRRADYLLREEPTDPATRTQVAQEARNLRIPISEEQVVLKEPARRALGDELKRVFLLRRITHEEFNRILKFLDDYGVQFEGDEQYKFVRCFDLTLLDQGILPYQKVDIALVSGEQCGFGAYSYLFETRKARRNGLSVDQLQRIDSGPLYITTKRILFIGTVASKTIDFGSLVRVVQEKDSLLLQKLSGKSHRFAFTNELDLEVARRVVEVVRAQDGSKIAPASRPGPDSSLEEGQQQRAVGDSVAQSSQAPAKTQSTSIDSLLGELDDLIGLEPVKREVRSLVNYLRVQRLRVEQGLPSGQLTVHLVFTGNPGTGKTTVARLLAKMYKAMGFLPEGHLVETDRAGLVGGYLGQTALKTTEVIRKALGGVLFIDEAYALARGSKSQESDAYGAEAIDTLLKAMEDNRDQLVVIVAGYREPMQQFLSSNPGLRSRFTRYIDFPDYLPVELMRIFENLAKSAGYTLNDGARSRAAALFTEAYTNRSTTSGNGRLVRTVFEQACVRLADRLESESNITRDELTTFHEGDIQPVRNDQEEDNEPKS